MDWSPAPREEAFCNYVAGALSLRQELDLLAAPHWLRGDPVAEGGPPGVRWLRTDGEPMTEDDWTNGLVKALSVSLADAHGHGALILSNASDGDVAFVLPDAGSGRAWRLRLDSGSGDIDTDEGRHEAGEETSVSGRCMQLYSLWPAAGGGSNVPPSPADPSGESDDQGGV
jgi:glycogen operon protein